MSLQTWQETLVSAQVDGTALNTSTTPTSILPAAARYTLPANWMAIGKVMRVTAMGRVSNMNPTPGNLTLDVRMGPTSNIVVFNGGAVALNTAVAKTNVTWWLEILLTCRAIGASTTANLMGTGFLQSEAINGAAVGFAESASLPASAPAVGTGFDSTVPMVVDLFATFSVSNAANSIQVHQYILEALN